MGLRSRGIPWHATPITTSERIHLAKSSSSMIRAPGVLQITPWRFFLA